MFTLSLIVEYAGRDRNLRHYKQMEMAALDKHTPPLGSGSSLNSVDGGIIQR